ncbi:amidohydrolase family protein (plasmid) [Haladaptatus sp. SPP-AMP-3]|uniref:amidohydrolase family protein n=1 Tax=Haladaptatus sp. SPP-AMP-3 TaxID=3121295 RepID=UPI003C2C13E9
MTRRRTQRSTDGAPTLIDCDIHQRWKDESEVIRYLPEQYKDRGLQAPEILYDNVAEFSRRDAIPDDGSHPGSDIPKMKEQHLDEFGVDYAILTGNSYLNLSALPNDDYAAELAVASNEWAIDRWLSEGGPFVGSLLAAPQKPKRMAEMIRNLGQHPRVVQVVMPMAAQLPYGHEYYWPMYEAAEEMGLPIALHPYTEGHGVTRPPTGAGYPRTYFEWHTLLGTYAMGQLVSLVAEGVLPSFPDLDFVVIEGGLSWVPHFLWRMDKDWKALRAQVPYLEKPPSEYVKDQVRFTTQPIEEPDDPEHLLQILKMMNASETVMFASDYPHWDTDSPLYALPPMPEEMETGVMAGNAQELYGLPDDPASLPTK